MNIIDRYLGQAVIAGVFTVLIILTAVYAVFAFGGEVGKIGQADYTVWKAIEYSVYLIPQRLYEIFPLSMLLGTMLGLGWLANNNELVIIRLAGISLIRIIGSIMKAALMLMLLAIVIGEGIAPPLYQYASEQRIKALNRLINVNTNYGLWAKDGETFINVNRVESDGRLIGVTLYQFTENNFVERQMFAKQAVYDEQQWRLKSVTEIIYNQSSYIVKKHKELKWKTLLDLNMVKTVATKPELLSVLKLNDYIKYLKINDLAYSKYELVYWSKIFSPLTILAMVLLAVPFVFGSMRQISIGKQILLGFLVGVTFYIVSRLIGQMGLVYGVPAALSALIPTLIVISITVWSYRRIR